MRLVTRKATVADWSRCSCPLRKIAVLFSTPLLLPEPLRRQTQREQRSICKTISLKMCKGHMMTRTGASLISRTGRLHGTLVWSSQARCPPLKDAVRRMLVTHRNFVLNGKGGEYATSSQWMWPGPVWSRTWVSTTTVLLEWIPWAWAFLTDGTCWCWLLEPGERAVGKIFWTFCYSVAAIFNWGILDMQDHGLTSQTYCLQICIVMKFPRDSRSYRQEVSPEQDL